MIKYVAFMKLRDDTPAEALDQVESQLRVLGRSVAEVAGWSCGRCLGSEGSPTKWTFAMVADFKDKEAYNKYREHPEHQRFRDLMHPYREVSVGMTYEANYPYLGLVIHEAGVPVLIPRYRLPPLDD